MRRRAFSYLAVSLILSLVTLAEARAGLFDVKVGYADGLRANGFFPDPWGGSPGVIFDGRDPTGTFDDGAVRIDNTGATDITVSSIFVDSFENGASFALWGTHTIHPGEKLILTATSGDNFDTSDQPIHAAPDRGGFASTAIPVVHFTIDGTQTFALSDTGQILNTGGFDLAFNPQTGGFDRNESLGWRDIGGASFRDPGGDQGTIPEPGSLTLFCLGLIGLAVQCSARRKTAV